MTQSIPRVLTIAGECNCYAHATFTNYGQVLIVLEVPELKQTSRRSQCTNATA